MDRKNLNFEEIGFPFPFNFNKLEHIKTLPLLLGWKTGRRGVGVGNGE